VPRATLARGTSTPTTASRVSSIVHQYQSMCQPSSPQQPGSALWANGLEQLKQQQQPGGQSAGGRGSRYGGFAGVAGIEHPATSGGAHISGTDRSAAGADPSPGSVTPQGNGGDKDKDKAKGDGEGEGGGPGNFEGGRGLVDKSGSWSAARFGGLLPGGVSVSAEVGAAGGASTTAAPAGLHQQQQAGSRTPNPNCMMTHSV
jgi:hypothetical protein